MGILIFLWDAGNKITHIDQSPHNIAIAPTHNQSPHEKSKLTFDKIYLKLNITTLVKMSI